jgi:hypothetical protein
VALNNTAPRVVRYAFTLFRIQFKQWNEPGNCVDMKFVQKIGPICLLRKTDRLKHYS